MRHASFKLNFFAGVPCCVAGFLFLSAGALSAFAAPNTLPIGALDYADANVVYGWAYDTDAGTAPLTVHIYIDGVPTVALVADAPRPDLVAVGVAGDAFHGFEWTPPRLTQGAHTIQAYAINAPMGENPLLKGTKTVEVTEAVANRRPTGFLDSASQREIAGWAYDLDADAETVLVHIYIDGAHRGTVLANERRDDLVAAGVAEEPYHGFRWTPPYLGTGAHIVSAFAINEPAGANPELGSSPRAVSVAEGEYGGIATIDNGVMRAGVNLNWGGALSEVSHGGINLVDDHDTGRLIQVSLYDERESYTEDVTSGGWGWNPVQGGDKYLHGSEVLAFSQTATSMYVKTQPHQWNPDNKGGGSTTPVPSNIYIETWLTLSAQYPQLLAVRHKITSQETVARRGNEEIPAFFAQPFLNRLAAYTGNSPWTNGAVSFPEVPVYPAIGTVFPVQEQWVSYVNEYDFGLTLYTPNHPASGGFNVYRVEGEDGLSAGASAQAGTSYARPALDLTLSPGTAYDITYYLIIGNYYDARSLIYDLRGL